MLKATASHKSLVVEILTQSFLSNKSVNYIVKQDGQKERRIQSLMDYAFKVCHKFGEVYLSDDEKACALIVYPERKRTTLTTILWDLQLVGSCTGIGNLRKTLSRERKIKALQYKGPAFYLWFIGVHPNEQNKGIGSSLLQQVMQDVGSTRTICLETSMEKNLQWYARFGFEIYNRLDLGYTLYFLKK